jgi:hypothetical protein
VGVHLRLPDHFWRLWRPRESSPGSLPNVLVIYRESDVYHVSCASRRIAELFVAHLIDAVAGTLNGFVKWWATTSSLPTLFNRLIMLLCITSIVAERGENSCRAVPDICVCRALSSWFSFQHRYSYPSTSPVPAIICILPSVAENGIS